MGKVYLKYSSGTEMTLEVPNGSSVMKAAVNNGIPGIVGECGGNMMCGTCHVYVCEGQRFILPTMSAYEDEMLEGTSEPRDPARSRLSCQLIMNDTLDGLHLEIPDSQ